MTDKPALPPGPPPPPTDCYRIAFDVTCPRRAVDAARRREPLEVGEAIVKALLAEGYHLRDTIAVTRISDAFR